MPSIHDFSARSIQGEPLSLADFQGQVLLIVNVASECGFTRQYHELQSLHERYQPQGFSVLGFPCNQFGRQEPGTPDGILKFCREEYAVTFPLFDKIDVNGPDAHPLYVWLKTQKTGILGSSNIKWNFTKFLIGRDGQVLARYGSTTKPLALAKTIEAALTPSQPSDKGNDT